MKKETLQGMQENALISIYMGKIAIIGILLTAIGVLYLLRNEIIVHQGLYSIQLGLIIVCMLYTIKSRRPQVLFTAMPLVFIASIVSIILYYLEGVAQVRWYITGILFIQLVCAALVVVPYSSSRFATYMLNKKNL